MCEICSQVKRLGIHKKQGQHDESPFVTDNVTKCKSAKSLLKKLINTEILLHMKWD